MEKRNWKRILVFFLFAVLVLAAVAAAPRAAMTGFGDFDSRSDYGGSRSGGSDGGSGGGSFDLDALLDMARFLGDLVGIKSPVVSLAILIAIFAAFKIGASVLRGRANSVAEHRGTAATESAAPETLQRLEALDPAFSAPALIARVKSLYEQMQACWEAGNIEPLRKDFMPDTWTRFNTQLQNKKLTGETAHVRDIAFDQVSLARYETDSEHQVLKIRIEVTHNIWTTNREGKNLQGTEKTRKRFEYLWTMVRPLGAVTGGNQATDTAHCPNCGAEIDLEAFAECPFCHTPVMKISPDWVISEIDALSQRTIHA